MVTYKQLKIEFDKKVKELQKICPHKKTKWMEHWWAIGHSTGSKVKVCLRCNKVLDKRKL